MPLRTFDFKHLKIRNKLSLLIAFVVAVSFAFAAIVQQYAFSIYDRQLYGKSSQVLNLSSSAIETELRRIEQISYNIIADAQMQSLLKSIKDSEVDYDRLVLRQKVTDRLISYAGSEFSIFSMILFDAEGGENQAGNVSPISAEKKIRMQQIAKEGEGQTRWMFPDASDPALILTREIRSHQNTQFDLKDLGTIVIRINIQEIVRTMAEENGDLLILSGKDLIYPPSPLLSPAELQNELGRASGYFSRSVDSEEYFVSFSRSSRSGWTYVNLTPYREIFEGVLFLKRLVIGVFAGIFVLVFLIGIRFSRSLTRPIDNLMGRMKLAEKGNFEEAYLPQPEPAPLAMDEIGLLHRTFRLMMERINTLITENYSNRLLLKETEFKALQAQINPHFLYNTLESINWLAKMNRQTQISRMVEALGYLFRHSIGMKEPMLAVADEIEIVQHYVTIQKYRFEERLVFSLDVPVKYRSASIPKLTLQPLIENAIHYALEPSVEPVHIAVGAFETEDGFALYVEDDGPGLPADTLDRLRSGELKTKGKGIGLLNIDERIKLAYGESYGLRIDGRPGSGARIVALLPWAREDNP
ncbi:cache domain-containing sensor histidine kinase [Cohnella caldifontis]|uniref:cache domain-containing sensor histidine kinase n=1 Tax=Cohnella caldifontis TaxID=3027471 RepID=UPI0023ECF7FE|nr:sensor histidine kinase [Cohnella sp. YIM B05605]